MVMRLCYKTGKESYASRVSARRFLRKYHGRSATFAALSVYFCHNCFAWHFGHTKPKPTDRVKRGTSMSDFIGLRPESNYSGTESIDEHFTQPNPEEEMPDPEEEVRHPCPECKHSLYHDHEAFGDEDRTGYVITEVRCTKCDCVLEY